VTSLYADKLLKETLPDDARRILRSSLIFSGEADTDLELLADLETNMARYATSFRSPSGDLMPVIPSDFIRRCNEFDSSLRKYLWGVGSRVDLTGFSPQPLTDPKIHCDLAGACAEAGIIAEEAYCDAVVTDESGRARASKNHILRLKKGEMFLDVTDAEDSAHVIRFEAVCPKTSAVTKMRTFSRMLALLHRTMPSVTGTPATMNDNSVRMDHAEWRFDKENSPWGFEISRLERFWLRAGAVTNRLFGNGNKRLALLREDRAIEFLETYRQTHPDGASPFALASRHGIYTKEILLRLREEIQ